MHVKFSNREAINGERKWVEWCAEYLFHIKTSIAAKFLRKFWTHCLKMALVAAPKWEQHSKNDRNKKKKKTTISFKIPYINLTSGHLCIRGFRNYKLYTARCQFLFHLYIINHSPKKHKKNYISWNVFDGVKLHSKNQLFLDPKSKWRTFKFTACANVSKIISTHFVDQICFKFNKSDKLVFCSCQVRLNDVNDNKDAMT